MSKKAHKDITIADLGLKPDQLETFAAGSRTAFGPRDESRIAGPITKATPVKRPLADVKPYPKRKNTGVKPLSKAGRSVSR